MQKTRTETQAKVAVMQMEGSKYREHSYWGWRLRRRRWQHGTSVGGTAQTLVARHRRWWHGTGGGRTAQAVVARHRR